MATVLLIDDHADLRDVMKELLEMHGHEVRFATSGEEAFSKLQDGEDADVVIADQRLPGMSGIDFLQKVRENIRKTALPIILCSADSTLRDAALQAGVDDFWVKGSEQLFEQISNLQKKIEEIREKPPESSN
jgi:CheY-like chemotaxis protein